MPRLEDLQSALTAAGLRAGATFKDWAVADVAVTPSQATLSLSRGPASLEVRLRKALPGAKYFARVGGLDLSHGPADEQVTREAGVLLDLLKGTLARGGAEAIAAQLEVPPPKTGLVRPTATVPSQAYDASEAPPLDASKRASASRPFMRFETIDLTDLNRFADALHQMHTGALGGLVIRRVYEPEQVATATARLADPASFPRTFFPERFKAHFLGRCLDGNTPDLDVYLSDAAAFRDGVGRVFEGMVPFEARIEAVFRALAGGREVRLPRFTDGRAYTPSTIRVLNPGGQIGTHCGNEASTRPAYTHLNAISDTTNQLSYFLTLQAPQGGGELIVYSLKWSDIGPSRIVGGRTEVNDLLVNSEWMPVSPQAGDLLLFDGGRYFHRVAPVEGPRERVTIGGFLMFSRAGDSLHYWS